MNPKCAQNPESSEITLCTWTPFVVTLDSNEITWYTWTPFVVTLDFNEITWYTWTPFVVVTLKTHDES
jgi:hypothetical protein